MKQLITYISALIHFSPESWEALKPALTKRTYPKGSLLHKAGEVCQSLFFIEEGFVRTYRTDEGTEVNTGLHFEGELVTDIDSFANATASQYSIEACEPLTVIVLDKFRLFQAAEVVPQIAILAKNCLSYLSAREEEHADLFTLYTPSERYNYIVKNKPYILQRVPLPVLASYLGMARETLHRMRNRKLATGFIR